VKQDSLELANEHRVKRAEVEIGTMARIDVVQTRLDSQQQRLVVGATARYQSQDQIKKLISDSKDPRCSDQPQNHGIAEASVASDIPSLPEAIASAGNRPKFARRCWI